MSKCARGQFDWAVTPKRFGMVPPVAQVQNLLNLKGYQNHIIGSKGFCLLVELHWIMFALTARWFYISSKILTARLKGILH